MPNQNQNCVLYEYLKVGLCTLIFTYKCEILTMCALKYHVRLMCTLDLVVKCNCVL